MPGLEVALHKTAPSASISKGSAESRQVGTLPGDNGGDPRSSLLHPLPGQKGRRLAIYRRGKGDDRRVRPLEVLVPMKPLATAKSRLAPVVPDMRRRAAALHMLRRVLDAVVGAMGAEVCHVLGGDDLVRRVVEQAGCQWLPEQGHDLNSSLWVAMEESVSRGSQAVFFLPADLPQATPADVAAVVAASERLARPVGVMAKNDGGTNALLVPAGLIFPPLLGVGSYARHAQAVRSRGASLVAADAPGLAVDVDTPEDLAWAEAQVEGFSAGLEWWTEWLAKQGERGLPLGRRTSGGEGGRG